MHGSSPREIILYSINYYIFFSQCKIVDSSGVLRTSFVQSFAFSLLFEGIASGRRAPASWPSIPRRHRCINEITYFDREKRIFI